MPVQTTYAINPGSGFKGDIARPSEPHALDSGVIYVPSAGRKPQPGDAVYYDFTQNAYALPTDDDKVLNVCGILSYRADTVQTADETVEFENDDEIEVGVHGTFWVVVNAAAEYGQGLTWNRTSNNWDVTTTASSISGTAITVPASGNGSFAASYSAANAKTAVDTAVAALKAQLLAGLYRYPVVCVSRQAVAANGLAQARIGFGRVA